MDNQATTHERHALLDDYFRKGAKQTFAKGQEIIHVGSEPTDIYCVVSGYVKIYSLKARGEEYLHIIYGPGEIFPLVWLIEKKRQNIYYAALTDCHIYCQPVAVVSRAFQQDSTLAFAMLQQSIEQYRIYSLRVDNLEYKYASERLAYRLLLLAYRFGKVDGKGALTIPLPLTHQLIGSSINLSRESVSREMEKLVRRGLVMYDANHFIVLVDTTTLIAQFKDTLSFQAADLLNAKP